MVNIIGTIETKIPEGIKGLAELGNISFDMPAVTKPEIYMLRLSVPGTNIHNSYEVYCYPANESIQDINIVSGKVSKKQDNDNNAPGKENFYITNNFQEACSLLDKECACFSFQQKQRKALRAFIVQISGAIQCSGIYVSG